MSKRIEQRFRGRRCAQSMRVPRRALLQGGLAGLAAMMSKAIFVGCGSDDSSGSSGGTSGVDAGPPLQSNLASIGDLGVADANGVRVPAGFVTRIVAKTGEAPVSSASFKWHISPDGGATYA